MTLISNGSMMLLKYKLNNVCDADNRAANGAQRTMIIHIYHNILWLSIRKCQNNVYREHSHRRNTHYLRIKCVLQAHHENNAYCVRIKSVLGKYASAHLQHHYCLIGVQLRIALTVAKKLSLMEGAYHYYYLMCDMNSDYPMATTYLSLSINSEFVGFCTGRPVFNRFLPYHRIAYFINVPIKKLIFSFCEYLLFYHTFSEVLPG